MIPITTPWGFYGRQQELAQLIGKLVTQGFVVALDEFQYFNRKPLFDFCSLLQADSVKGGLIVLGSLHAEMSALLEDRAAPLFNRTTDVLALDCQIDGQRARATGRRCLVFSAPQISADIRAQLQAAGVIAQPLQRLLDLLTGVTRQDMTGLSNREPHRA